MWPRIQVWITPIDQESGTYRVRVGKAWWKGPGHGGTAAILGDFHVELRATDERERIREALRAAADLL